MKKIVILWLVFSILLSCKKSVIKLPDTSSLLVTNAAVNIASARAVAFGDLFTWAGTGSPNSIAFGRSAQIGMLAGNFSIKAVSAADTNLVLYNNTKGEYFEPVTNNSLFLCGNTGAYDGVLIVNDNIPNYTDSVMGIRFINLSPNSSPINISLSTSPSVNEIKGLAYKQFTDFKLYPSLMSTVAMTFQVRDANNVLLTSFTLPVTPVSPYTTVGIPFSRFKNVTLAIKGLQGTTSGTNAFSVFPVAHY